MEEMEQGRLSMTALVAYMALQKERYRQNKKNEGTFVCSDNTLKRLMGSKTDRMPPKIIKELTAKGLLKKVGKTKCKGGTAPIYELPELIETNADKEALKVNGKKEAPKETEHNQLNNNDMGNFIGTLDDFGIQGTEPVITYTNGEQKENEEDEVTAYPVIPKQETIVKEERKNEVASKEETKPDEPPTVEELLEPYKEYLNVPFDDIPQHVMDEIIRNDLENHFIYKRKGWEISSLRYPKKKNR